MFKMPKPNRRDPWVEWLIWCRLAYKKLIRMNMPLDREGRVHFTTTLFALIRENLNIKVRVYMVYKVHNPLYGFPV
jgi:hypothetical protein